ncbi:MAG TPA: glycosyltransferase [Chitinophagales bacterium]|nr:glycosyltransferase [Chitinophagales bacterium]
MKLSVVIVNYNVKYFLHQALNSIYKSEVNFDYDVFVVDNASVDGSAEMVEQIFPQVKLIASPDNLGFSKGNNLAIRKSTAQYVLLLNPDTIIREDTLQQVVNFMEAHPEAGALGVKMYDGQGQFLPESKRGFPSPKVAFYKMSGLSKLFPKSKTYGEYHLGYLDDNEIHEVDVLSGAFMLLRKNVLDQVGLLDEDYFMYGEDIDLSYRIQKAGYKNYYFPNAPIIHFKGESTKKGSLNYVRVFYQAMIIFARKHLQNKGGSWYIFLLQIAIYFRAGLALVNRLTASIGLQILDILILAITFIGMSWIWEHWIRRTDELHFSELHFKINLPIYVSIWILVNYLSGVYEKSTKLFHLLLGMISGTIIIGALYGFFPNAWRSSRGIILFTFILSFIIMSVARLLIAWGNGTVKQLLYSFQKLVIVGSYEESKRVIHLLNDISIKRNYKGFISPDHQDVGNTLCLGTIENINEILNIEDVDEMIFCSKDISSMEMITQIASINQEVNFKIVADDSDAIIGSHSKDTSGDLLTYDVGFRINQLYLRRLKRFTDVLLAILFLLFSPILIWIQKNKSGFLKNILSVFLGQKTWVSYSTLYQNNHPKFKTPDLPSGVLDPLDNLFVKTESVSPAFVERQNYLYAKDYQVLTDLQTIFNSLNKLGA